MSLARAFLLSSTLFTVISGGILATPTYGLGSGEDTSRLAKVREDYGKLPLSFEVNQGQTDPEVRFLSRGLGYGLFLTPAEAILTLSRAVDAKVEQASAIVVGMKLVGAKTTPEMVGVDPLPGKSHYLIGNDPKQWHTNVARYAKVKYKAVYPGIDLVYYGNQRQLEYDLVVAPGADPKRIRLAFHGVDTMEIDGKGQLVFHTAIGEVIQHKPVVYQEINGERKTLDGRYVVKGKQQVGFQVARYDASKPLIIDPVLAYSTYLGGGGCDSYYRGGCSYPGSDAGFGIAVDSAGSAYVTGSTVGLPTTLGAFDEVCGNPVYSGFGARQGGCYQSLSTSDGTGSAYANPDAFVTKLSASGSALVYSTYLGGSGRDGGRGIAVDGAGHAYVTGYTHSGDFPASVGAYDLVCGCSKYVADAFVTKLNPLGSALVYSTFLSGSADDAGSAIAVDVGGNAYVTGTTSSTDFPTSNAVQTLTGGGSDAFVTKLDPAGAVLVYSTFLGGSGPDDGNGIAVDGSGNASVTGSTGSSNFPLQSAYQAVFGGGVDAFVTKLNAEGTAFLSSTYLGGGANDYGHGIALDSGGNIYVAGATGSTNFPTTMGAFTGAFASKLDAAGTTLVYSTNPGGSSGNAIAVNGTGNAYVAGANGADAFVTRLNATGTAQEYTFALGGSGGDTANGIALDSGGNAYVTGATSSSDFPTTPGAFQTYKGDSSTIFVSKIANVLAVQLSVAAYSVGEADGTLSLSAAGADSGTVTSSPAGINCGSTCSALFVSGTTVILTATPDETLTFVGWTGACTGTGTCAVTMDAAKSVAATFALIPYNLSIGLPQGAGGGAVTLSPPGALVTCTTIYSTCREYPSGALVILTATPNTGSVFAGWSGDPDCADGVVLVTADATCTPTFNLGTAVPFLGNISARARVLTGSDVLIGGFLIGGTGSKTVLIRARGPSMSGAPFNLPGTLSNPIMRLYSGSTVIAQNDDWQTTDPSCGSPAMACGDAAQISATAFGPCQPNPGQTAEPPGCSQESAMLVTLPPGGYTTIVSGVGGATGIGLVEVFEVGTNTTTLVNISTRSRVETAGNVLIGGFIIGGTAPKSVVLRARGPSMGGAPFSIPGVLADPTIELYSGSTVIARNDNWQAPECPVGTACIPGGVVIEPIPAGFDPCQPNPGQTVAPPNCALEATLAVTLSPGGYTAIARGMGGGVGVGLVEVFEAR